MNYLGGEDRAREAYGEEKYRRLVALRDRVGAKFVLPESPMHCVIKGTAAVLAELDERQHLLIGT